jgi:capsular exopolysaccharide synthesis family protein
MSRIHEALKKAEQERAAGKGSVPETAPAPVAPVYDAPAPAFTRTVHAEPQSSTLVVERPETVREVESPEMKENLLLTRSVEARWNPDPKTMLFFGNQENLRGMEQFRTLRARLFAMRERSPLKTILVASALPKEGKSFVSANLAQVLARREERRVLLIDGDMRAPQLHAAFGTNSTPGLGEYLLGEADEFSVMQHGSLENLFFVPSGRTVEHPAELIANGRFGDLLRRVEPLFDWVILDSPPAVPVSDASLLASYCDGVLMVVRSHSTPYDKAQRAQLEFAGKNIVGAVLNGMAQDGEYARYYADVYEK